MFRMGKVKVDLIFQIIKEKVGESSKLCRDKWWHSHRFGDYVDLCFSDYKDLLREGQK